MYKYKTEFYTYENVELNIGRYPLRVSGNEYDPIFISLHNEEVGDICVITINALLPRTGDDRLTAIDVGNCPFAEDFLRKYGLGEKTGFYVCGSFNKYPIYRINTEKLLKIGKGSI